MKSSIDAEIIAVGTELLLGQIPNTNAQWLSEQLAHAGVNVLYHGVVGDNPSRVQETFKAAQARSDLVIVTGGLGPTDDDMTREAFSTINNIAIFEHERSLEKIQTYFKKHNMAMTPNNRRQARVFEGAEVLDNTAGMAPGMVIEHQGCKWVFLPGVPREMERLFHDHVLTHVKQLTGDHTSIQSTVLKFFNISESRLEHELKDLIVQQHNPTIAPLSQLDGNVIRLTAKGETQAEVNQLLSQTKGQIIDLLGDHYIGSDDDTLESVIVARLKEAQLTVGAAESLTGGLFTAKIIGVPGASDVCPGGIACYHSNIKEQLSGVTRETLDSHGAVSEQCALEMARGMKQTLGTDIGMSFTGVAGPDTTESKPVGTVYIALVHKNGDETVQSLNLEGNRNTIREKTVFKGMEFLFKSIK